MNIFEPAARCSGCGGFYSASSAACGATAPLLATLAHVVACRGWLCSPVEPAAQTELCERESACDTTCRDLYA